MGYPEYPEHGHLENDNFGVYLHPVPEDGEWGIITVGGGTFQTKKELIPTNGRLLEDFGLVLITQGSGVFCDEHRVEHEVVAGDMMILLPGKWHSYKPSETEGWQETWLLFSGTVPESLHHCGKVFDSQRLISLPRPSDLLSKFLDIINTIALHQEIRDSIQGSLAAKLLSVFVELRRLEKTDTTLVTDTEIEALILQLNQGSLLDVDWNELAAAASLSIDQFRRRFRAHTRVSPHQYLLYLRIKKAQGYLLRSNRTIENIAVKLGYGSSTQFSRIFKAKTGVTPSQWKSEHAARH
jgi:AraC-like DNA-binding protein